MADKRIDELEPASSVTTNDLFVLEQAGTAKRLDAQTLENWLLALAQGHGGIVSVAKTGSAGTDPVIDTYTITFSDTTTATFTVTNGLKGDTGAQTFVYIKYSNRDPIADTDMTDTPSDWMGICSTTASTAPTTYSSYSWYEIKGATGATGAALTIVSTSVQYQAWSSGTQYPTGTWVNNPPAVTPGNYLWTRTIVNYSDGGQTVSYSVGRWGLDGSGAVASVNTILPDQNGNVTLTASDVGALPDSYQPPVTSVNGNTGAVVIDYEDVGATNGFHTEATLSESGWYRVLTHTGSIPDGGIIKFKIGRNQNGECHIIDLLAPYTYKFLNEVSSTGTNHGITKIRLTIRTGFVSIDVYYALATTCTLCVDFVTAGTIKTSNITVNNLQSVADAPSGETVNTTYNFNANLRSVISDTVSTSTNEWWHVRKYSDGWCEVFGRVIKSVTLATVGTYYHRGSLFVTLPVTFTTVYAAQLTIQDQTAWCTTANPSGNSVGVYVYDVVSTTENVGIVCHVEGYI